MMRETDINRNALHEEDCRILPLRLQKQQNYERIAYSINNRSYRKIQKKLERACWKDECR
jgi:hypothetical protein